MVGNWLCLPTRTVERMAKLGEIPSITLPNGELVFDHMELHEWLEKLRKQSRGREVVRAS